MKLCLFIGAFVASLYVMAALALGHGSLYCGHKEIIGEPTFGCYVRGLRERGK